MEISFTHTNPEGSHDSTLLTIETDDTTSQYLIDAGENATPGAFTNSETGLDGVFLTHAHRDHYASLSQALDTGDPSLYTAPGTAVIIEQVYGEADRYADLGDLDVISDALAPIDGWTSLEDNVDVLPVPAGHTPGAAGFLFRVDDFDVNHETVTILATGDFTIHRVAGYPGIELPDSIDVDILIANAGTCDSFRETLSEATETILERALSGATTLVAASGLMSVHTAYVLGHLIETLDRQQPIALVGQAAKLYNALDYDVPNVTTHETFTDSGEVLEPGTITIGGPQDPTQGSAGRLLDAIEDDSGSVIVQLATGQPTHVEPTQAGTHHFELSPHPTSDEFVEFIQDNLPRHLIIKHTSISAARSLGNDLDAVFYWSNDDTRTHLLYDDGSWPAPTWVDDSQANRIRQRNYQESGQRIPLDRSIEQLPTVPLDRLEPDIESEGIDVDTLVTQFQSSFSTSPIQQPAESDGGQKPAGSSQASDQGLSGVDTAFQADMRERLDGLEATVASLAESIPDVEDITPDVSGVESRLEQLEASIENLPAELDDDGATVIASVLRQGDLVLLRPATEDLEAIDVDLEQEQQVALTLHAASSISSEEDDE